MFLGKFIKIRKLAVNLAGISLIETLIALTILIVGVLAIVQLFPLGLKASQQAKNVTIATNLAQAKMEEIISEEYEQILVGNVYEPTLAFLDADFASYARLTVVHYVDENLNQIAQDLGLKKVEVSVGWLSKFGDETTTTTLTTLIADL